MQLSNLLTLLTAAAGTEAYIVKTRAQPDCQGFQSEVNVWDNTCRNTYLPETRSIEVLAYGAGRQGAEFWSTNTCWLEGTQYQGWWADGGSDTFLKARSSLKA